jgi:hypothetical protein
MKESKQIEAFQDELNRLIERFADEFDLTLASMIGVMHVTIHELIVNTMNQDQEEDDEDEED